MSDTPKHIPKGSMCASCEYQRDDCSGYDFSRMKPIKADNDTVVVICDVYKKRIYL